jgi:hypothetical protein
MSNRTRPENVTETPTRRETVIETWIEKTGCSFWYFFVFALVLFGAIDHGCLRSGYGCGCVFWYYFLEIT